MTVTRHRESRKTRLLLFGSSLAPALIIAGLRLWDAQRHLSLVLCGAGLVAFLLTPVVLFLRRKAGRQQLTVSDVKDESGQVPTYLLTFVFPFLFLSAQMSKPLIVAYVTFAVFMGLLLYRTPLALINPAMLIAGYRVFSLNVAGEGGAYVLAKEPPLESQPCYVKRVAGGLYITTPEKREALPPVAPHLSLARQNGQERG